MYSVEMLLWLPGELCGARLPPLSGGCSPQIHPGICGLCSDCIHWRKQAQFFLETFHSPSETMKKKNVG